jgi:hypothetical protein
MGQFGHPPPPRHPLGLNQSYDRLIEVEIWRHAVASMLWLSVCSEFLRASGGFISKIVLVESGENYSD